MKLALLVFTSLIFLTIQAHAYDNYNSGYNLGYYTGALAEPGSDYGRGVADGGYDAYEEDRRAAMQRSDDVVSARAQQEDELIQWMSRSDRSSVDK